MKDLVMRVAELFGKQGKCMRFHRLHNCSNMTKCRRSQCKHRQDNTVIPESCPIPDPIDITDLGKALECYRTTPVLRRLPAQRQVRGDAGMGTDREEYLNWWMLNEATAEQIWGICCLAKESEEKP